MVQGARGDRFFAIRQGEVAVERETESGLRKDQIIISCKVSRPLHLISVYRELAKRIMTLRNSLIA